MAEWVGALLCLQSDLSGLQGGDRGRGGGGEATPVAGQAAVTSLLAGCVNSTSDLYGNRTASTPLLPSWQTVGTRGTDLHFTPLSLSLPLAGLSSSGKRPWIEQDMTREDSFGRDLSGRPGFGGLHCRMILGSEMAQLAESRCQPVSHAVV